MATEPKLAQDRTTPPGDTDNGSNADDDQHNEDVEPENEPDPEPDNQDPDPDPDDDDADDPDAFEADEKFVVDGKLDARKLHDSYKELEKKLGGDKEPDKDLERDAQWGRYAGYLTNKYPNLPLAEAHKREEATTSPTGVGEPDEDEVEELSDEQVEDQVNDYIAKGQPAKATMFAADHTKTARNARSRARREKAREAQNAQRAVADAEAKHEADLQKIRDRDGPISEAVHKEMQKVLKLYAPNEEVHMDELYQRAKLRVGEKPRKKPPAGRQPARGSGAPVRQSRKQSNDDEYLANHKELSLDEVLEKERRKK